MFHCILTTCRVKVTAAYVDEASQLLRKSIIRVEQEDVPLDEDDVNSDNDFEGTVMQADEALQGGSQEMETDAVEDRGESSATAQARQATVEVTTESAKNRITAEEYFRMRNMILAHLKANDNGQLK